MLLADLFPATELESALAGKFVRARRHPELPLTIYNYTEHAQYKSQWDQVTRNCRGLIVDDSGRVAARPWAKFFNYEDHANGKLPALDLDAPAEVADKLDGSLGILYPTSPDPEHTGWSVATRGNFVGEQAIHGTAAYREKYQGRWHPDPSLTYLFEIVYPQNRIVLDYGDTDDLVLLGANRIATGEHVPVDAIRDWPGPRAELLPAGTLREALALEPRARAEGIVVTLLAGEEKGTKVKIKQYDYLRLHRIVSGASELAIWDLLATGKGIDPLLDGGLPDEFHAWTRAAAETLLRKYHDLDRCARQAFKAILGEVGGNPTRKEFALAAREHRSLQPLLFLLLDGNEPKLKSAIWRQIRPKAENPVETNDE